MQSGLCLLSSVGQSIALVKQGSSVRIRQWADKKRGVEQSGSSRGS